MILGDNRNPSCMWKYILRWYGPNCSQDLCQVLIIWEPGNEFLTVRLQLSAFIVGPGLVTRKGSPLRKKNYSMATTVPVSLIFDPSKETDDLEIGNMTIRSNFTIVHIHARKAPPCTSQTHHNAGS